MEHDEMPGGGTYLRPDLRVMELGASVQYVFNHRKFSFKAAFQNTEYQKKSAGSWLLGADAFYGLVRADSSLVPGYYHVQTPDFHRLRFLKAGPSAGYAFYVVQEVKAESNYRNIVKTGNFRFIVAYRLAKGIRVMGKSF